MNKLKDLKAQTVKKSWDFVMGSVRIYGFQTYAVIVLASAVLLNCSKKAEKETALPQMEVKLDESNERVDILVDGKAFTSYLYTSNIPDLKKTALYPVYTATGIAITRGFPLDPKQGERADHPHHIGYWLNYGEVNELDYWGHSAANPAEQAHRMGTIRHGEIRAMRSGSGQGELSVSEEWQRPDGTVLLNEATRYVFTAGDQWRSIDRITTLTAREDSVLFNDTKEGMLAIRVRRELELQADGAINIIGTDGQPVRMEENDNSGVSGQYLNSNGITGYDVWGKRAKWTALSGVVEDEKVSIVIFDHPDNLGYPTYWHARGYGLFAANPLGQNTFSEGVETMNFSLAPNSAVTFKYRLLILSGEVDAELYERNYQRFINEVK